MTRDRLLQEPAGVRVLIVDDSPIAREVLKSVLETDRAIHVIGMAGTGREAIEMTAQLKPDLVTMDLVMPGMDGMEATQQIMANHPTPILFFSAFFGPEGEYSRSDALAAGALDIVEKPAQILDGQWRSNAGALAQKVKSLARVPVITHIQGRAKRIAPIEVVAPLRPLQRSTKVVAIGASTGGPKVLDDLLPALPADYSPSVIVVQHLAEGFMAGWLAALQPRCALTLKVAEDGDRVQRGRILFAPSDADLTVLPGGHVRIENGAPAGACPSVDITFDSVAQVYGARAAGVLLTGMGTDGAAGLLAIRRAGGRTMAQDEASCVVFGMPRAAIGLDAAQAVLPPVRLARSILALHEKRRGSLKS